MASTDHKKFKTTASSKGAGVDVHSESVLLPPDSEDHVLTVTADSSCTGEVDVQLEMSPDGNNWCPAVTRTVTVTPGTSTTARTGNEEYVKLTPDAGEFKNKHCRGGLNFNTAGAVVTPDGSGTRDLMDQHIATTKSFNYSQWFKTSENPTTTYKPVLFRHGGYDDFSNAKTIELTDGTGAGTLANTKDAMGVTYDFDSSITSGLLPTDSFTVAWWVDLSKLNSGATNASGMSNISNTNYNGIYASHTIYGSNFHNRWYSNLTWRNGPTPANQNNYYTVTDWTCAYLVVTRVDASAGVGNTATTHHDIFKDDGTHVHNFQSSYTIPSGYTVGAGITWTAQSGYGDADDMIILDSFTSDTDLSTLYNTVGSKIVPKDWSSSSGVNAWYRIGDNATDDLSDAKNHKGTFPDLYSSNSGALTALSATDNLYSAGPQKITQNLCNAAAATAENSGAIEATSGNAYDLRGVLVQDDSTFDLTDEIWSYGFWFKSNTNIGSGNKAQHGGNNSAGAAYTRHLLASTYKASSNFYGGFAIQVSDNADQTTYPGSSMIVEFVENGSKGHFERVTYDVGASLYDGNWHHMLVVRETAAPTPSSSTGLKIYIDGSLVSTTFSTFSGGAPTFSSITDKATIVAGQGHKRDSSGNLLAGVHGARYYASSFLGVGKIDNACFWKSDQSSNASAIYNSGKPLTTNPGTPTTYLRFEDSSNLDTNSVTGSAVSTDTSDYTTLNVQQEVLTSGTDSIFIAGLPSLHSHFDISTNLSISGWFKTTGTGVLFSNTDGAAADGMKLEVNATNVVLTLIDSSQTVTATADVDDGEWHHILVVKPSGATPTIKIYVDGVEKVSTTVSTITNDDLKGANGFTLLGDGQQNGNQSSPSSSDSSKLQATISNWSIHSEVLDANAALQLYSNGHVRNIKNLPSVTASAIEAWWQLSDNTTPLQDLAGSNNLVYQNQTGYSANDKYVNDTYRGALTSTTSPLIGNYNKDCSSDNVGFFPSLESSGSARSSNNVSYSFWYKPDSTVPSNGTYNVFWSERYVGSSTTYADYFEAYYERFSGNDYLLLVRKDYTGTGINQTRYWNLGSSGLLGDNTWRHFTITTTSADIVSGALLYIDGVLYDQASSTYTNTSAVTMTATKSIHIGGSRQEPNVSENDYKSWTASGNPSAGKFEMDQFLTWNKVLTQTEVRELIGLDSSGAGTLTGTHPNNHSAKNNIERWFNMGGVSDGVNLHDVKNTSFSLSSFDSANNISSLAASDAPYYAGALPTLTTELINATGATYVNGSINGNALTLSLTKSFDFTTNKWVSTADKDLALCLSLNGFEEQAEYFALWKCSQTVGGVSINICDGGWHNVILSYRGKNNLSGDNVDPGDTVKFGPGPANSLAFNWAVSFDGQPLTSLNDGSGADFIGGLNTIVTDTYNATSYNVGFAIQDRHLKYLTTNSEEIYKPHAQFSAGIHEVSGVDNNNAFQGSVDETSFHSDDWWVDQAGTSIVTNTYNQEKPATIYGNTTALGQRQGATTDYPEGKPYDLLHPERLTTSGQASDIEGTNQYINPNRYDSGTNPNGGLEGWWRWGDTPGDCSITINDVKDHNDSINARDISAFGIVTADRVDMSAQGSPESIYITNRASTTSAGSASISFPQVIVENIQSGVCNLKDMVSPVLQYLRVKFTGSGSCDLGEGKAQARINFTKRRKR